jgi:hypothetical protein
MTGEPEASVQRGEPADLRAYREALSMWLAWNRAHEALTAQMFDSRHDPTALGDLMDQADELRRRAIEQSEAVLGR